MEELIVEPTDVLIDKYANDVFYKSQLQGKLTELDVNELVITGCATDFCVEFTIQSALTKEYDVIVVEDGHTTGDRPHLKADKVIEKYFVNCYKLYTRLLCCIKRNRSTKNFVTLRYGKSTYK